MTFSCDHDSMKQSLATFMLSTNFVGVQLFAGGVEAPEIQYMGNCPVCNSTLAVVIDLARGHTVKGQIDVDDGPLVQVRNIPAAICTHPTTDRDGHCSSCGDVPEWSQAPEVKAIR